MALTLKVTNGSGGGTEKAPVGNHLALLVGIFEMGTQENTFQGQETKWQRRAYFVWELVGEMITGTTKNHVIGIDLTFSLNEKATLRKWIEARTGKVISEGQFDLATELGQPCMLNVVEKNGYPKIAGVAAVPQAFLKSLPKPGYTPTIVELEQFKTGTPIPDWCPWLYGSPLEDHIKACQEIGGPKPQPKRKSEQTGAPAANNAVSNDPVPF